MWRFNEFSHAPRLLTLPFIYARQPEPHISDTQSFCSIKLSVVVQQKNPCLRATMHHRCLVIPAGFEPSIFALKGRLPKPISRRDHIIQSLVDQPLILARFYVLVSHLFTQRTRQYNLFHGSLRTLCPKFMSSSSYCCILQPYLCGQGLGLQPRLYYLSHQS